MLSEEILGYLLLFRDGGVVDSDGVAAEHLDDLHTRNVCLTVSEIYHMREWNPLLLIDLALVDLLVVPHAQDSFVDLEEELGLVCVVNRHSRPLGFAFLII